jgi:hypothetical protein
MIKFLKFLWKKCFGGIGDSRTETEVEIVKPIPQPKPLHCVTHNRFKKSCPNCQEVIK